MLPGLTYGDDIVLSAEKVNDMQLLLDICIEEAAVLGLPLDVYKSAAVVFAGSPNITLGDLRLGEVNMPVLSEHKYLGIILSNADDYSKEHHAFLRRAAIRGASILRKRSLWTCDRFIVSKELWKAVVMPGLTLDNGVVCVLRDVSINGSRWAQFHHGSGKRSCLSRRNKSNQR